MFYFLNSKISPFIFIAIISVLMCCCNSGNTETKKQEIGVDNIVSGPIVHDTLSKEQIERITSIYNSFSEVNPATLKETITDFKKDQHPDNEINVWLNMAKAYNGFIATKPAATIELKKEAYKLILIRSMVNENEAVQKANLKLLTEADVKKIFSLYTAPAQPITVERK